ncbi:hypothetical protein EU245_11525 [Lentibacillus lipolyticus]|nr:hypothetical protein EU245_11525 [Lentibacillus lipolyticus]
MVYLCRMSNSGGDNSMLQAKTKDGKLVTLASMTRQEITMLKKSDKFFCPTCSRKVIARAGTKVIPHFAHEAKTDCPAQEGGEGAYHEKGKLLLYQWLKGQKLHVLLEPYIPEIGQRPDLLLRLKNRTIAFEYQCARIPAEHVAKRSRGYVRAGIIPIWILGATNFHRSGQQQLKVNQFHLPFVHQFSSDFPHTLYFFCPNTLQFISFQDLHFFTLHHVLGKWTIRKLNEMVFTDLFHVSRFTRGQLLQSWKQKKRSFRLRAPGNLHGRELTWHQWLYARHASRQSLPSPIYLPVASQHLMKTPPWDWQSRLCLDIIAPLGSGDSFHYNACTHLLRNHLHPSSLFPLLSKPENPITAYLKQLEHLQMIRKTSASRYTKKRPFSFYEHVEDAVDGDDLLMVQLMKQNSGMITG